MNTFLLIQSDIIDTILSITMIGALFALIKLVGYFIQKKSDKTAIIKEIAGFKWTVIRDDKHELIIGDKKKYSQAQMIAVIKEVGNNYDTITFVDGTSGFAKKIAAYMNGVLVYEKSGKAVDLRSSKE